MENENVPDIGRTSRWCDDLYIIGAVCLSQKSLFPYSKDLVVSHVYSYIPYSKELVVSMFLDTFVLKGIGRFNVS